VHGISDDHVKDACLQPLRCVQVAADVMVQEYGRYFGIPVCCRAGCLTGPITRRRAARLPRLPCGCVREPPLPHLRPGGAGARQHHPTTSAPAFLAFYESPQVAAVQPRRRPENSVSILEAVGRFEELIGEARRRVRRQEPGRRSHLLHQRPRGCGRTSRVGTSPGRWTTSCASWATP
jgi:CDP-paratose 2-epimerase